VHLLLPPTFVSKCSSCCVKLGGVTTAISSSLDFCMKMSMFAVVVLTSVWNVRREAPLGKQVDGHPVDES